MKAKRIITMTAAFVLILAATAFASGTATISVSATVNSGCWLSATSGTITFPAIDPGGTVAVTAAVPAIDVDCNANTTITVVTAGGTTLTGPGSITYSPGTVIADGTSITAGSPQAIISGSASIAVVDFTGKPAGVYTDTLSITITP